MERAEVAQKVESIIKNLLGLEDYPKIHDYTNLKDDLGADSLDATEIIIELEAQFAIEISEGEDEKLATVGQVVDLVHKKVLEKE